MRRRRDLVAVETTPAAGQLDELAAARRRRRLQRWLLSGEAIGGPPLHVATEIAEKKSALAVAGLSQGERLEQLEALIAKLGYREHLEEFLDRPTQQAKAS